MMVRYELDVDIGHRSRPSPVEISYNEDIYMAAAEDNHFASGRSNEIPFIYVATLSIKWAETKDQVFSTWMTFGENTRDLGSFGEETDEITDLHQILKEVLLTERRDGVASIKRRRHDLFSNGVWNLETASGRGQLKEDLELSM
ncbi:hypothetical protein Tco_0542228 [Tanacetum coccineum]